MVTTSLIAWHLRLLRTLAELAAHTLDAPVASSAQAWVEWVQQRARLVSRVADLDPPRLAAETEEAAARGDPAEQGGRARCALNACYQREQAIAEVLLETEAAVEYLLRGRLEAIRWQLVRRARARQAQRTYLAAARQDHGGTSQARSSNRLAESSGCGG